MHKVKQMKLKPALGVFRHQARKRSGLLYSPCRAMYKGLNIGHWSA